MKVSNSHGDFECQTKQAIEVMIRKSALHPYDDIWISGTTQYPCLAILVNGDYACVHYFLNDKGDMWQSIGTYGNDIAFVTSDGTPDFTPEEAVISLEKAIECMNLFFDTLNKPDCIEWREL